MKTKQLDWTEEIKKRGKRKFKGTCIHYSYKESNEWVKHYGYQDMDRWSRWHHKRVKNYEMFRANKSKTKETDME